VDSEVYSNDESLEGWGREVREMYFVLSIRWDRFSQAIPQAPSLPH
jgi:hypothetical protein